MRENCGLELGRTLVVGVSGGPDSLALLHFLHASGYPLLCATFNHRLRPEAEAEVAHVGEIAAGLGVPFVSESADVKAFARAQGLSLEEAARTLRYRFLFAQARKEKAQAVAVGHTADDQVETVLMHFLRGAGLSGLKGMPYRTVLPVFDTEIPLARPLLDWWRNDTEAYCRAHSLAFVEDASNAETTYFRNRLRHTLIPALEAYNPQVKQALWRTALSLQGDDEIIRNNVGGVWNACVEQQGQGFISFNRSLLHILSPGLRRRVILRAAGQLRPDLRDMGYEALERAAAFIDAPLDRQIDLAGGLYLFHEGALVYVACYEADLPAGQWPQVNGVVKLEGECVTLGAGWALSLAELSGETALAEAQKNGDPFTAWLDADLTEGRLQVRARRWGDRLEPLGLPGKSVKLSDLFINLKIPKRARENWPLVCADEQIAWVAGLRPGYAFRVTEETRRAVKLTLRKLKN